MVNFNKLTTYDNKISIPRPIIGFALYFLGIALSILCFIYINSKKYDSQLDERYQLFDLEKKLNKIKNKKKLCIVIVGEGIPEETPARGERPYANENSQGYNIYEGIRAAISEGKLDTAFVDTLFIDDGGIIACARRIGEILSRSEIVLCVIGHTTTATTLAALPYYKMANIPVIMPVATNPTVIKGYENISFRMPTNDKYQCDFITAFIEKKRYKNICLIWDQTPTAFKYSFYIKDRLEELLGTKIKRTLGINYLSDNIQTTNAAFTVPTIPIINPDLIIYCGYGSLAKEFFTGLKIEYDKHQFLSKPDIILTDGCNIPNISIIQNQLGFKSFLSFPGMLSKDADCFKKVIDSCCFNNYYSYEVFSYDAINIIGSILRNKPYYTKLNRNYLIKELSRGEFKSTCYQYIFENGENQSKSYCMYSIDSMRLIEKDGIN